MWYSKPYARIAWNWYDDVKDQNITWSFETYIQLLLPYLSNCSFLRRVNNHQMNSNSESSLMTQYQMAYLYSSGLGEISEFVTFGRATKRFSKIEIVSALFFCNECAETVQKISP